MELTHTPVCQMKGCENSGNDTDFRFGQLIFFCNTERDFHSPRSGYKQSSFSQTVEIVCANCYSDFRADFRNKDEGELVGEIDCPECGHTARLGKN